MLAEALVLCVGVEHPRDARFPRLLPGCASKNRCMDRNISGVRLGQENVNYNYTSKNLRILRLSLHLN